jgi:hypothetical protein
MSLNSILLIIAIVLVVVIFLLTIIQLIRKKRTTIGPIAVILLLIGVILLIPIVYNASEIKTAEWVQIILTIGLLTVTAVYAASTEKQAQANIKMAEEMREQRYDLARPVIDIQFEETAEALISAGISVSSDNYSSGLLCKLQNIGVGPAVDVHSNIQWQSKSIPIDIGTIAVNDSTKKAENFTVIKDNDSLIVKIYYQDIYGRNFESSRKVLTGQTESSAESGFGPLLSILVEKNEVKND